jgi:hypothetical protein
MPAKLSAALAATVVTACLAGRATPLYAQGVEIMPFGGYRFGGDFFELIAGQRVDVDGSPALGVVVNVPLSNGLQVEGLFTHQNAMVSVPAGPFYPSTRWNATVAHAQVGGLPEFVARRTAARRTRLHDVRRCRRAVHGVRPRHMRRRAPRGRCLAGRVHGGSRVPITLDG